MKALVLVSLVLNAVLLARLGFAAKKGEFTEPPKQSTAQISDAKAARESISPEFEPQIVTNTGTNGFKEQYPFSWLTPGLILGANRGNGFTGSGKACRRLSAQSRPSPRRFYPCEKAARSPAHHNSNRR